MPLFIAGVFRDRGLAERVVTALLDAGIASSEIAMAVREESEEDVNDRDAIATGGNEFDALAVHSAWERLGWLSAARLPYRDKIPPDIEFAILTAGPLAVAIGGAQVGATAGGIVGSMTNFGYLHETAGEWYERIRQGQPWLMVRTSERDGDAVRRIFDRYNSELRADSVRHW